MAFEKGQKVIALVTRHVFQYAIIKDKVYEVGEINVCRCGVETISYGMKMDAGEFCDCPDCGDILSFHYHHAESRHFSPLQYASQSALMELAVTFKEIIERSDCPVTKPEKIKA